MVPNVKKTMKVIPSHNKRFLQHLMPSDVCNTVLFQLFFNREENILPPDHSFYFEVMKKQKNYIPEAARGVLTWV